MSKKIKKKQATISIILCLSLLFAVTSCAKKPYIEPPQMEDWQNIGDDTPIKARPTVKNDKITEILKDLNFSGGFNVTAFHANTSGGKPIGILDYNDMSSGKPNWTMAQWGCINNMMDAKFLRDKSQLTYVDGGKKFTVDASTSGKINMGVKGSTEYPLDSEGRPTERPDPTYNWPHILLEQRIENVGLPLADEKLYMQLDYKVTECDRKTEYPLDISFNAAQFQWFISLQNTNSKTESYLESMWFGFNMFDTRAIGKCPAGMASYDGGKEDNTGMFIYMFSLDTVTNKNGNYATKPSSVVGVDCKVKVDIMPYLKNGLQSAQRKGALKGANLNDLKIGSTNIGWELPGSYDVNVQINNLNLYIEK